MVRHIWWLAIAAVAAGLWIGNKIFSPTVIPVPNDIEATLLPGPRNLPVFELVDHKSEPFTLDNLIGHWTFLFFGYTHCPDVCPTTLSVLNSVATKLNSDPEGKLGARFAFVSVDPERDTPERLAQFVPYYNKEFSGVTGAPEDIEGLTRFLGIMHMRVNEENEGGYLVDHTASVLLVDPQGRFYGVFSPPLSASRIDQDFRKIAHYYEETQ
jgi:protein SCO1/2